MIKRKLQRQSKPRKMLIRNLVTSAILYEKITTTAAKAKETKGMVDKVINVGKKNNLAARRKLMSYLTHKNAVDKIFDVLIERYKNTNSGYTTTYKLSPRLGDGAPRMMIRLINTKPKEENTKATKKEEK